MADPIEIECPVCGKTTLLLDATREVFTGKAREELEHGERPKFICTTCWQVQSHGMSMDHA